MENILTPNQLRNIRRRQQRKRASELKNQILRCNGQYLFYQSNRNTGNCSECKCSVCDTFTSTCYPCLHGSTALCSDECQESYSAQFLQLGISPIKGNYVSINGKVFEVVWTGLQKNKDGDICLVVEDPDLDVGEYTPYCPIYIPLSQATAIVQLPRTYIHNP